MFKGIDINDIPVGRKNGMKEGMEADIKAFMASDLQACEITEHEYKNASSAYGTIRNIIRENKIPCTVMTRMGRIFVVKDGAK